MSLYIACSGTLHCGKFSLCLYVCPLRKVMYCVCSVPLGVTFSRVQAAQPAAEQGICTRNECRVWPADSSDCGGHYDHWNCSESVG